MFEVAQGRETVCTCVGGGGGGGGVRRQDDTHMRHKLTFMYWQRLTARHCIFYEQMHCFNPNMCVYPLQKCIPLLHTVYHLGGDRYTG